MSPERQIDLMKAIHSFKLDQTPLQENISSQKINSFFGAAGGLILNLMKIIVPFVTLILLQQTVLVIILGAGCMLVAVSFVMTFFNQRSMQKKLKVEFEKFQTYLKNKGFTEKELRDTIVQSGGIPLK